MRRRLIAAGAGLGTIGCAPPALQGEFTGADLERGHKVRDGQTAQASGLGTARRTKVAIIGAGIAGLSAARALRRGGIDDYQLFELDREVGGNSRAGVMDGMACPWGAHYLPVPNWNSPAQIERELTDLLLEFGLLSTSEKGPAIAQSAQVHAPQERLLINGQWQTGLLPVDSVGPASSAAYQRFAELVDQHRQSGQFQIAHRLELAAHGERGAKLLSDEHRALDRMSFAQWLSEQQLHDTALRWYLDYCCLDDYGASSQEISAWAGLQYFASRHGFAAPSASASSEASTGAGTAAHSAGADDTAELLTWPEGNAWLARRLAAAHRQQIHLNAAVVAVDVSSRGSVAIDVWHALENRSERWIADEVVIAVPLNVAARIVRPVPAALAALLPRLRYSAWQVANVLLRELPPELPGAPLSWDNVVYGRQWLGFVDATHQLLQSHRTQTVWTSYRALGTKLAARQALLQTPWREQAQQVLGELRAAYPRIERSVQRIEVVRWGHAMLAPVPGLRSDPALTELNQIGANSRGERLHFAHSDTAGYSVFEEAFAAGLIAARQILKS